MFTAKSTRQYSGFLITCEITGDPWARPNRTKHEHVASCRSVQSSIPRRIKQLVHQERTVFKVFFFSNDMLLLCISIFFSEHPEYCVYRSARPFGRGPVTSVIQVALITGFCEGQIVRLGRRLTPWFNK